MDTTMEGAVFVQTNASHNEVIDVPARCQRSAARDREARHRRRGRRHPAPDLAGSVTLTRGRPPAGHERRQRGRERLRGLRRRARADEDVPGGHGAQERDRARRTRGRPGHGRQGDPRLPARARRPRPHRRRYAPLSSMDSRRCAGELAPDGRTLIVTERGTDMISAYAVGMDELDRATRVRSPPRVPRPTASRSSRTARSWSPRPSEPRWAPPPRRPTGWMVRRSRRSPRASATAAARSAGRSSAI